MKLLKDFFIVSYCSVTIYIVFFARRRRGLSERFLNVVPIKYKLVELAKLSPHFDKEWYNFYLNLFGNIALFVPFPLLIFLVIGVNESYKFIFISFFTSLLIEIMQYTFKVGVADIDDILLNTIGAIVGVALMRGIGRLNIHA
ncbi:VanZ family protein [Hymenobacter crusticola]|nr:VanZ family protein [Hymenobacter crusticola]